MYYKSAVAARAHVRNRWCQQRLRRRQDASLREPWSTGPEKPRAARRPSAARRSGLLRHPRTGGAELRATPPTSQTPRDRREISLRAVFRGIGTARLYGSLRETSCRRLVYASPQHVAREHRAHRERRAVGPGMLSRQTATVSASRPGHAARDSTMALGSAVSRDDSWAVGGITPGGVRVVSTGAGGHGCHASRPSARGRDVPGALAVAVAA